MMAPKIVMVGAPLAWLICSVFMLNHVEPFYTHFYSLAWWCYILLLSSLNEIRGGESAFKFPSLFHSPLRYAGLILFSAAFWFFFELYNARLHNWVYTGVPAERWVRWPGYFISFGTVLPGIFETARWIESRFRRFHSRKLEGSARPDVPWRPSYARVSIVCGAAMMTLPLLFPALFFPIVWAGLIFMLDPLSEKMGDRNLVANLFVGDRRRPLLLLLSGVVCGFFWEFWNYWAGAKWVYSLPYFQFPKIFEMPLLGYLGFPPFAMECWLVFMAGSHLWRAHGAAGRALLAALLIVICAAGIFTVDRFTIREYRSHGPDVAKRRDGPAWPPAYRIRPEVGPASEHRGAPSRFYFAGEVCMEIPD